MVFVRQTRWELFFDLKKCKISSILGRRFRKENHKKKIHKYKAHTMSRPVDSGQASLPDEGTFTSPRSVLHPLQLAVFIESPNFPELTNLTRTNL